MKQLLLIVAFVMATVSALPSSETTESELLKIITASKDMVVIDFYADWCGFCKKLDPMVDQAEKKLKGKAVFLRIDVDKNPGFQSRIRVLPTVAIIKKGKIIDAFEGCPPSVPELIKRLEKDLKK